MMVLNKKMYNSKHISEKGPSTFKKYYWRLADQELMKEMGEIKQWTRGNNAIFNCKTDYWSLGVIIYIGHTDNASKKIQPQLQLMSGLYQEQYVDNWIKVGHISMTQFNF